MDFSDERGTFRRTQGFTASMGRGAYTHHQGRPFRGGRGGGVGDRVQYSQNVDAGSHSPEVRINTTSEVAFRENVSNVRSSRNHSGGYRDFRRRDSVPENQASGHLEQTSQRSTSGFQSINIQEVDVRNEPMQDQAASGHLEQRSCRRGSSGYHQRNNHEVDFRIESRENQALGHSEHKFRSRGASGSYQRNQHESDRRNNGYFPGERLWTIRQTNLEENHISDKRTDLEQKFEGLLTPSNLEKSERGEGSRSYSSDLQNSVGGEYVNERIEAEQPLSSMPCDHATGSTRSHEIRHENIQGRSFEQGRRGRDLKADRVNVERKDMIHEKKNWRSKPKTSTYQELKSKHEKFSIPQLVQELEEKILGGKVECMICCEMVGRTAATWSCASCYSMFHLTCIRKWAQAPSSVDMAASSASRSTCEGNWRCPGCQSVQSVGARELRYQCFCGKLDEPAIDYYLTPHSCGEPCQKLLDKSKLGKCKHLCTLQCHPGPCPPCAAFAPPQSCSCGKANFTRRCTDQEKGPISCGKPCGRRLQCRRHSCSRTCHAGDCDACEVMLTATCFCGKMVENLSCGHLDAQGELDFGQGVYSCGSTCGKKLSCKNHLCFQKCHPGPCAECEVSPSKVQTCSCGKWSLKDLFGRDMARESCLDPVPTCGQDCGKLLLCKKHQCQDACHVGPCSPCIVSTEQKCRCGSTSRTVPCHVGLLSEQAAADRSGSLQDNQGLFLCDRKCDKKKSCGRHRCNNRCCFLSSPDGQVSVVDSGAASEHLCLLTCGKKLRCGKHSCQDLCHTGHCPPCLESTFTELSCACGRSSILPPVACGTPLPSCEYPCAVPQPCGHPVTHSCHFGDCPPCSVPVAKECVGNHVTVRNVPCGSREIKCNMLCGKPRQCGLHACARTCHLPPCDIPAEETSNSNGRHRPSCSQLCGAPRRDCSHTCAAPCHPTLPCPEEWCRLLVSITCSCGRLSAEVPCAAGGLIGAEMETKILVRLAALLQPLETREKIPLGQRKLVCDDDCAKAEKKRILANAFGESGSRESTITVEGAVAGSEVLELAKKDPQFVAAVEDRFRFLLLGPKRPAGQGTLRLHVFCGLPMDNRELIRQLAERWSLSVNAVGRDPRRCFIVHATPKSKVPTKGMVSKGSTSGQAIPNFNPAIDMEPGLVVGLFDLPRDADVSTLVLRFGGECELVWLNDKNALAIFNDEARASTALRRVDHASTYYGAVSMPPKGSTSRIGWGVGANSSKTSSTKKSLQESSWVEDAWSEDGNTAVEYSAGIWQSKAASIRPSKNPWGPLKHAQRAGESSEVRSSVVSQPVMSSSRSSAEVQGQPLILEKFISKSAEDEDWENAFD